MMRAVFGVLSLLVVVAVIGMLAKKQLSSVAAPSALPSPPGAAVPARTPQQSVQQFQQAVESQMQQPRAMPDETK